MDDATHASLSSLFSLLSLDDAAASDGVGRWCTVNDDADEEEGKGDDDGESG